jgi:hypothetical protein
MVYKKAANLLPLVKPIGSMAISTLNDEGSGNVWYYEEGAEVWQVASSNFYVFCHLVVLLG